MYKLSEMVEKQRAYIQKMKNHANDFIDSLDKNEIETILLSGSVSRGDYCPGKNGGMIDLIVMKKEGSKITAEELFGKDEDPFIPFHCIRWNGEWFEILFTDFVDCNVFKDFNEPRKFSVMESKILYDANGRYAAELKEIEKYVEEDLKNKLEAALGYIKYIIGKEARWEIREAYPHMHNNLNIAIELGICCLYYFNGKYAPADDRKLYYTYELEKLPQNYETLLVKLFEQKIESKEDYGRRKKIFVEEFIGIMGASGD
jgi:hypothetical protein